jgi:hypothetical protein
MGEFPRFLAICEKAWGAPTHFLAIARMLAHTFSQSHTFSQYARKCVGAPHTFSQIARKRAIARVWVRQVTLLQCISVLFKCLKTNSQGIGSFQIHLQTLMSNRLAVFK